MISYPNTGLQQVQKSDYLFVLLMITTKNEGKVLCGELSAICIQTLYFGVVQEYAW